MHTQPGLNSERPKLRSARGGQRSLLAMAALVGVLGMAAGLTTVQATELTDDLDSIQNFPTVSFDASSGLVSAGGATVEMLAQETLIAPLNTSVPQESRFTVTVEPGTYKMADGNVKNVTAAAWECRGYQDNPHHSKGAPGVIAKARLFCTGQSGTIPISVHQILGRTSTNSISTLRAVKTSTYTQGVVVNSTAPTVWYVPRTGPGATRGAYFRASHAGQSAPPLITFYTKGAASQFIWVP